MLKILNISGKKIDSRVKKFSLEIDGGCVHALLCLSTTFLGDFLHILRKEETLSEGMILLDGKDYFCDIKEADVQFMTNEDGLYQNLSVADNILFLNRRFFLFDKHNDDKAIEQLVNETGFHVKANDKVFSLTSEKKKIVEILKCYFMKPKVAVISEISTLLSYKNFSRFIDVLEKMKQAGTDIVYLTSQWEEAIKVADIVTVVSGGANCGTYKIEDLWKDPSQIYDLLMGGKRFQKEEEDFKDYEILKRLDENIKDITSGYDLQKTLYNQACYLIRELGAESCIVYLINSIQDSIIDITAQRNNASGGRVANLQPEIIWRVIKDERQEYFYQRDRSYAECFAKETSNQMVIAYPIVMSSKVAGLIQLNFEDQFTLSKQNNLVLGWIAKEMAIVIENSRLMGRSMLLQESYHRIKNNLQIIVSLIELEKDVMRARIRDQESWVKIEEMLDSVVGRVKSIAQMHNLLSREKIMNRTIDMRTIVMETGNFYQNDAQLVYNLDQIYVPYSKAVSIALIINELINNSIKHNPNLAVTVEISAQEDKRAETIGILCRDHGGGFVESQLSGLGNGVGMKVIRSIVCQEFGGELQIYNENGAVVEITIPVHGLIRGKPQTMEYQNNG